MPIAKLTRAAFLTTSVCCFAMVAQAQPSPAPAPPVHETQKAKAAREAAEAKAHKERQDAAENRLQSAITEVRRATNAYIQSRCKDRPERESADSRLNQARFALDEAIFEKVNQSDENQAGLARLRKANDDFIKVEKDPKASASDLSRARAAYGLIAEEIDSARARLKAQYKAEVEAQLAGPPASPPVCPPPSDDHSSLLPGGGLGGGSFVGIGIGGSWADLSQKEFLVATGALTNQFENHDSAATLSLHAGHDWHITGDWSFGVEIGGTLRSLQPREEFAPGVFLGAETDWSAQALGRIGFQPSPDIKFIGLIGVGVTEIDSQVHFGTQASDAGTVMGVVYGGEAEFPMPFLNDFAGGMRIAGALRYTHTDWEDKDFNAPSSSPAFNYQQGLSEDRLEFIIRLRTN